MALDKDKDNLLKYNKVTKFNIINNEDSTNDMWLIQYRKMAYITMIFFLSIIIVLYYWFGVMFEEGLEYWIILAIIGIIIVLFNYYRMITQRVRTKRKNFYWSK